MPYFIFDMVCVFAPMSGYFDQLIKMYQTKNSTKFKLGSSLVLLFSNYLRIVSWFGEKFAGYLFWQSVVTIIVHISLCYAYYKFLDPTFLIINFEKDKKEKQKNKRFNFHPFQVYSFKEFFITLIIYWIIIIMTAIFFCFFLKLSIIGSFIGLISNLIDSFQTFPPFYSIIVQRDINCVTNMLVLQYLAAIVLKSVLFLCRPVPWTFRVGLAVQAFFAIVIAFEYYRQTCTFQSEVNADDSDEIEDVPIQLSEESSS